MTNLRNPDKTLREVQAILRAAGDNPMIGDRLFHMGLPSSKAKYS